MQKKLLLASAAVFLLAAGYTLGIKKETVAYAGYSVEGGVPKAYGRLVAAVPDQIGTDLVFEDTGGVIRFVSMNGRKEGELARYEQTPTRGGIPKAYGHLVTAVVDTNGTQLVFEDKEGVIRFVTLTGVKEGELKRD